MATQTYAVGNERMTAGQVWESYAGAQDVEEFVAISRAEGRATTEEMVASYVAELPAMFGAEYTEDEIDGIARGMAAYLVERGIA